jgi:hypothetical protein
MSGCAPSLCERCINAQVTQGFSVKQKIIICANNYESAFRVEWPVAECSEFREKESVSLVLMKEIAWHISPKVRGKVGFSPPGPDRDKESRLLIEEVLGGKDGTD